MPVLNWSDKNKTLFCETNGAKCVLKPDNTLSFGEKSENKIIMGDNLKVLNALLPEYKGKVKCVYIDPPYNSGNNFEHYDDNLEHSKWLSMLYPRLKLLREFLSEDGYIFIQIDDNEQAYLKVMSDEIFGRKNFCGTIIWEKKKKPSFLNSSMGIVTEYILAFAKNKKLAPPLRGGITEKGKKYPINNAGNPLKTLTFPPKSVDFMFEKGIFEPQDMSEGNIKTKLLNKLVVEGGKNKNEFSLEGEWRYSQNKINEIIKNNETITISKAPFRPNHIKKGGEPKKLKNLLSIASCGISTNEDATEESRALFGVKNQFDYPKPEKLMQVILNAITEQGDLVLDAFLGSGTTCAVAHKMKRKYIGIEMGQHAITHCVPRMKAVINGEQGGISKETGWHGGGGYVFYKAV